MSNKRILRHSLLVRTVHWLTVLSTLLLFFSGIGQMPMYKRYMVSDLPGMAWTADYQMTLILHYVAAAVFVFTIVMHGVYHFIRKEYAMIPKKGDIKESLLIVKAMLGFGKEPPSGKFLAEQRLAYAFMAFTVLLLTVTGLIKVGKNFAFWQISESAMVWVTLLHNVGMVLMLFGIVAHLGAFIAKANRPLVPSIFTGYVSEEYIKERHSLWYEELTVNGGDQDDVEQEPMADRKYQRQVSQKQADTEDMPN